MFWATIGDASFPVKVVSYFLVSKKLQVHTINTVVLTSSSIASGGYQMRANVESALIRRKDRPPKGEVERWAVLVLPLRSISPSFVQRVAVPTNSIGTSIDSDENDLVGKFWGQIHSTEYLSENHVLPYFF